MISANDKIIESIIPTSTQSISKSPNILIITNNTPERPNRGSDSASKHSSEDEAPTQQSHVLSTDINLEDYADGDSSIFRISQMFRSRNSNTYKQMHTDKSMVGARQKDANRKSLFEGYAYKLCPSVPFLWQRRYFVVRPEGCIYYYVGRFQYLNGDVAKGVIDASDIRTEFYGSGVDVSGNRLSVAVRSKNQRIYRLQMSSNEEALAWAKLIRALIHKSRVPSISAEITIGAGLLMQDLLHDDDDDERSVTTLHI